MTDDLTLSKIPNDRYRKLFERFKEIDTLPVVEWKKHHLLAYFCHKYKEAYNLEYVWKFNTPAPSKCFEVWQISSLAGKLSAQPKILKHYIDWVFENVVPFAKRRLTSISFLTKEETVTDYKRKVLWVEQTGDNIDRSAALQDKYIEILVSAGIDIKTYGDLAFITQTNPIQDNVLEAITKMEEIGFDREALKRIV
jgi:hypothetical protein